MAQGKHPMTDQMIEFQEEYDQFIGYYESAVDVNLCRFLCEYMDKSEYINPREMVYVQDKQISLDTYSPAEASNLMQFVNNCLGAYVSKYTYLTNFDFISSLCLLQKTEPEGGYHIFHGENLDWNMQHRTMAWMVYLNDVPEGGETEFLYQKRRFKPKAGTVMIWPGGYTHLHRGNPPLSTKYIATGWYQGSMGLSQVHTAGLTDPNSPNFVDKVNGPQ
tara:strand:+ start:300 stop:956 length:657 start_codon:yes stop_codon:yes gene_type:complete